MVCESYNFNEEDTNFLATWLGLKMKGKFFHDLSISLFLFAFLEAIVILTIFNEISKLFYVLPLIISVIQFLVLFCHNYKKRRLKYISAINDYYNKYLSEYEGYYKTIVGFKDLTSNKEEGNYIFLTNGYKFVIIKDPLKKTKFKFKDGYSLKVINNEEDTKYEFLNTEIKDFIVLDGAKVSVDKLYNSFVLLNDNIERIEITLNDYTKYLISSNVYKYIKESNPLCEVYNEK